MIAAAIQGAAAGPKSTLAAAVPTRSSGACWIPERRQRRAGTRRSSARRGPSRSTHPHEQRERQRPTRLPHLLCGERHVVPGRLREERPHHRRRQSHERGWPPRAVRPRSSAARRSPMPGNATPSPPPRRGPRAASARSAPNLAAVKTFCVRVPALQSGRVGGREQDDDAERDQLHGRHHDRPDARARGRLESEGNEDAQELGEGHGDRGDRSGLDDEEHGPTEQKSRQADRTPRGRTRTGRRPSEASPRAPRTRALR